MLQDIKNIDIYFATDNPNVKLLQTKRDLDLVTISGLITVIHN